MRKIKCWKKVVTKRLQNGGFWSATTFGDIFDLEGVIPIESEADVDIVLTPVYEDEADDCERRFEATLEETDVISLDEAHRRRAVGAGHAAGTRARAAHEGSPGLTPATSGGGDRGRPSGLPFRFRPAGAFCPQRRTT